MTCPKCGTKTRSRTTACPTCGHRARRYRLLVIPFALALIAFIAVVTHAYLKDSSRSTDSLADKVKLNITDDTVSADGATTVDLDSLQESLYTVSYGTGFLISPQDVLTAASNVAGLTDVTLQRDGEDVSGTVVGRTDSIAVIRIEEVDFTPFSFTQAIAANDESLLTMTTKDRLNGTVTFNETGYVRNFDLPRYAIGSPLLTENGRVLAIHLRGKALPVALFEQDVRAFLESDTPAPPTADLAPVAPIAPLPKEAPVTEEAAPPAPAPAPEATPEPEAAPEAPVEEAAPPVEEPVEPTPPPEEETTPEEPAESEQPTEEQAEPPVTEPPAEPEPPVTEPAEPVEPEQPAKEAEKPLKKQDNKPKDKPKEEPPVKEDKPKEDEPKEEKPKQDPPASTDEPQDEADEESTPSD
ncbi:trypsin-like peptidase domain-containing protein [Exiguobacterium sp.]|uniref:trypsin-like peptidase domain-containing protein n=1 Tax=Exiguobacterium sp. TaxID=44751 RepID=UPI00263B9A1A|nr:trypsin-like peptidase domain-containing protein [Exiguobacterium sp.]MCC5891857.1 hypothetical protein [Exiguobacterium sp.]